MRQFVFAKRRVGRLRYERTSFCHSLFAAMFPADFLNDDMPPAALSFRAGLHGGMRQRHMNAIETLSREISRHNGACPTRE